jgi:DNA-binding response OmpR family regulator
METSVLVVEDDPATAGFLADNLMADGLRAAVASSVGEALRALEVRRPDAVLLDLTLDDGSGLVLLDAVRSADGTVSRIDPGLPIIVITGRGSEVERVRGFARGADDYVVKPFSYPELVARLHAVLRRSRGRPLRGRLVVGDLEIDPVAREVTLRGQVVELSAKEYALLQALALDPTRVVTKTELLRDVWGYNPAVATRTVDVHAYRLRRKLAAAEQRLVISVRGVGYRLMGSAG